jgi:hypothetical protein
MIDMINRMLKGPTSSTGELTLSRTPVMMANKPCMKNKSPAVVLFGVVSARATSNSDGTVVEFYVVPTPVGTVCKFAESRRRMSVSCS